MSKARVSQVTRPLFQDACKYCPVALIPRSRTAPLISASREAIAKSRSFSVSVNSCSITSSCALISGVTTRSMAACFSAVRLARWVRVWARRSSLSMIESLMRSRLLLFKRWAMTRGHRGPLVRRCAIPCPYNVTVLRSLLLLPPAVPGGDLTRRQTPSGFEIRAREVRHREERHLPDVIGDTQQCGSFSFVHEMECG